MEKNDIKTSYGVVRNINSKKIQNTKLYKKAVTVLATASIIVVMLLTGAGCNAKQVSEIPNDQIKIIVTMKVESGDTISDIADKYYNDDCNNVYNSVSNYVKEIQDQNNISKYDHIESGDTLKIPVIIDKDNTYYLRMQEIQSEIKNIEANNLWVRYTVQYGDRISTIAELASGSYQETYEITEKIASKNNMRNKSILNAGEEIWIMNPELGELKSELKEVEEQLKLSLTGEQIKK